MGLLATAAEFVAAAPFVALWMAPLVLLALATLVLLLGLAVVQDVRAAREEQRA